MDQPQGSQGSTGVSAQQDSQDPLKNNESVRQGLGMRLSMLWEDAQRDRREQEEVWLKDYRQYAGEYDPEVKSRIHPKRSKAFIRITRTKVRSTDARMNDLLFPVGDKNWTLSILPKDQLDASNLQQKALAKQLTLMNGQLPDPDLMLSAINKAQQDRCDRMSAAIESQLLEGSYQEVAREVMHSGHVYGTGILKGPLVDRQTEKHWEQGSDGHFKVTEKEVLEPYFERVSIWDFYPDMSARYLKDTDHLFQRHIFTKHDVRKLAAMPGFNSQAIRDYLRSMPEGDARYLYYENQLNAVSNKLTISERRRKYEILEFWGFVDGQELKDCGLDMADKDIDKEYEANVWLLGDIVIKCVLNPTDKQSRPYHAYYLEKDDTSIWGVGIPSITRDPQQLFNSALRMAIDNAAISAGPQIEANQELLADGQDAEDMHPFKVWVRNGVGAEANFPALRVYEIPSHVNELMELANVFKTFADEAAAIPAYVHGENDPRGAAGTASGLSMLMGQSNIVLKDLAKNYDEGVTRPFIQAMYDWNMQWNDDDTIKGDFEVDAQGSASLVMKEVRANTLMQFAAATLNPMDATLINRASLLRKIASNQDLGNDIVKSDDQIKSDQQQQQAQQAAMMQAAQQAQGQPGQQPMAMGPGGAQGSPNPPPQPAGPAAQIEGQAA